MRTKRHSKNNKMVLCYYYVVNDESREPHGAKVKSTRYGTRKPELYF